MSIEVADWIVRFTLILSGMIVIYNGGQKFQVAGFALGRYPDEVLTQRMYRKAGALFMAMLVLGTCLIGLGVALK